MELLFRTDPYARFCKAKVLSADENGIRLDRTVFYPTGGGQPGDQGLLRLENGSAIPIRDTVKGAAPHEVLHLTNPGVALPETGMRLTAELDWDRRYRLMRMHTCLHLLCAVVPGEVTGGQVGDGKGRLDFNLPEGGLDKETISAALNELIADDHPVRPLWITDEELASRPELVRTMSVKPPTGTGRVRLLEVEGIDLQPCGGTHIRHTAEIGPVQVTKIESKGRQNRRITIAFVENA
jgi:misacylated tRNA(Ala) deacylase